MSKYFQGLNYGLANEDTRVEYDLAPENAESFFAVCGSGSRVLPLLAKNPKELHVVDLSDMQLMLFRLRLQAAKRLSYNDFLYFLGYIDTAKSQVKRSELILKLELTNDDLLQWKSRQDLWENSGFIYLGKWERHFMKLGKTFQRVTFRDLAPVFEAKDFSTQKALLEKYWSPKLFKLYLRVVMNEWVANKLLYKGSFAGGREVKTMDITAAEFVYREFSDLFLNSFVKENYFLQMIFLNKVSHSEGFPIECSEELFEGIKSSTTTIYYHQDNLLKLLNERPHDFYSLSDTFSYMKDSEVKDFLASLPPEIRPGSKMVIRTFMRRPAYEITEPWFTDESVNRELMKKDCTRMYEFNLLTKR